MASWITGQPLGESDSLSAGEKIDSEVDLATNNADLALVTFKITEAAARSEYSIEVFPSTDGGTTFDTVPFPVETVEAQKLSGSVGGGITRTISFSFPMAKVRITCKKGSFTAESWYALRQFVPPA